MPRRTTSLAKLPLSERLAIHNALQTAPADTALNGPLFGLILGGPCAPLDVSTIYLRIRAGELPPPDCRLGKKSTAWTLGLARKTRTELVERAAAMQLAEKGSALGRALSEASVRRLRERQTKQHAS